MKLSLNKIAFFLFFGLYLILPEHFAVELSGSLPLLTGSRVVLTFLLLVYLASSQGRISLRLCRDRRISQGLYAYFLVMIFVDIINIRYSMSSLKAIFTVVFEEWAVVWGVTRIVTTKKRFMSAVRTLVGASGIVAVLSIISTLIGHNLFYFLNTVQRTMLQSSYIRMGLIRAEAGFGHPVYYGMYCVLMMILAFFLYEKEPGNRRITLICIVLNLLALVLANSRGSMVTCAIILILIFLTSYQKMMKNYCIWIGAGCIALLFICIVSGSIRSYVVDLFASLINVFNKNVTVSDYGGNASGMSSRLGQLTSIIYVLRNSPVFGLGAKCHENGLLQWFWNGQWRELTTLDMGIVAIVVQYGLLGLIMYINLFAQWIRIPLRRRKEDITYRFLLLLVVAYLLGLLTISNLHDTMWVISALTCSYINIDKEKTFDVGPKEVT
ncbi:MAG: O-antigen ligase family protein [Lachnospiraceae bacterium]|nr:O-antigen ligase family protein [Lachnospiraceae bacterium]